MKKFLLTASAFFTAVLSLFMLYSLRDQDKVQIWKNYNVVYIAKEYSEPDIISLIKKNGFEGIVSRDNSLFSVKNNMLPTLKPYDNEGFTSETMRSFFFSDKSDSFFLLYVPEDEINQLSLVLKDQHIPYGIDASVKYPVLCPVICLAAYIILMLLARIRFSKAICLLPVVAVSYTVPFYSVAASILCFMFVFCIIDIYDFRKKSLHIILKKVSLWFVFAAGIIAAYLSGKKAFLLISSALIISSLLLFICHSVIKISRNQCHFQSVPILTSRWVNIRKRYNIKTLLIVLIFCTVFMISSLISVSSDTGISFSGNFPYGFSSSGTAAQDLLLPSPSGYTETEGFSASSYAELSGNHDAERNPDLSDFLNEKWYAETAAYRKVNVPFTTAEADEKIILPSFREEDGLIIEKDRTLFSFDDNYIASSVAEFGAKEGIEKLLVSEDGFYTTGYATSSKMETPEAGIPAAGMCALLFLVLTVIYCLKRHKK